MIANPGGGIPKRGLFLLEPFVETGEEDGILMVLLVHHFPHVPDTTQQYHALQATLETIQGQRIKDTGFASRIRLPIR